jgi:ubiquinone/menaquinone biosynthesis C-methylase UbiE
VTEPAAGTGADWAEWLLETRFAGMTEDEREAALRALAATRDRVLAGAALRDGDDVLDLGAGTGLLAFGALERIGNGVVYAVDPSTAALDELLRLAHERRAAGIRCLVGDASAIPLPDDAVDVCVTRSVLMYVDDVAAAVAEIHRVLRPGGRLSSCEPIAREGTFVATTVDWTPVGRDLAVRVVEEWRAHQATSPLFRLDDEELVVAFAAAGFEEVRVELEELEERWTVDPRTADARLDAVGAAGAESLRQRWQRAFAPAEIDALVAHLHGLAGRTLTFRRPQAWITARRP